MTMATMTVSPGSRHPARLRAAIATAGAAVLGAAPHVLHHAGPLAGAAIVAGATGTVLFGALGLLLAIPMLRRIRSRTGSWRVPSLLLASMAAVFAFSSLVIGPALTSDDEPGTPPPALSPSEHDSHHP